MGFILKIVFSTKSSIPIKWKNALISDSWLTTSFLKEVLWVLHPVRLAKWEQTAGLTTHLRSRKREETQTPTPDQPCDCCISLPSSHPCATSTSQTHTNVWEKARIPQKSLETKARATFSTKSLQKRERFPSNYYHIITISWKNKNNQWYENWCEGMGRTLESHRIWRIWSCVLDLQEETQSQ